MCWWPRFSLVGVAIDRYTGGVYMIWPDTVAVDLQPLPIQLKLLTTNRGFVNLGAHIMLASLLSLSACAAAARPPLRLSRLPKAAVRIEVTAAGRMLHLQRAD